MTNGEGRWLRAIACLSCLSLASSLHAASSPLGLSRLENLSLRGGGFGPFFKKPAPPPPPPPPAPVRKSIMDMLPVSFTEVAAVVLMAAITHLSKPSSFHPIGAPHTIQHVFYYGWIAALSTGLGVLPLLFMHKIQDVWLGLSNAVAAGMMISACYHLVEEGLTLEPDGSTLFSLAVSHPVRVVAGLLLGAGFVISSKKWIEKHEDLKFGNLTGKDLRKVFLMVAVMTLHSFSEGLGIGVSFTGKDGAHLGAMVTATLAMHNIPEGLAVALVLMPRGVSKFSTILWAIFTSMPQPLIAVPVFIFARHFIFWQSVGLGFAAGSMLWVTFFELLADAMKDLSLPTTAFTTVASFAAGHLLRHWLPEPS